MNEIYCGDIRDIAKTLPEKSVNCIVTSPPYLGLRDYGTAEWEGGKAECDHKSPPGGGVNKGESLVGTGNRNGYSADGQYRDTCLKCGAKRIDKQIGLEESPEAYVNTLVGIFRELRRVLRDDGSVWLNLGDSYAANRPGGQPIPTNTNNKNGHYGIAKCPFGLKPKNLIGIPWRVAFALQADGWILRSDIIWHKRNPMPESVRDRPTKSHEYIFLLSKKPRYYYDNEAVREKSVAPGSVHVGKRGQKMDAMNGIIPKNDIISGATRTRRTVWSVSTRPYKAAHFAVFPPDLIRPCILAGCPPGGVVFDPFMGSGTVAQVAIETGRNWLGVELNPEYIELAKIRIAQTQPALPIEMTL